MTNISTLLSSNIRYFYYTIQYNTIQYNTIQYNTIQYNTIQYNTIQYNTIQYNTIQYNTIQYNTIQYNTIQYNTIQYNTIQYFKTLKNRQYFSPTEHVISCSIDSFKRDVIIICPRGIHLIKLADQKFMYSNASLTLSIYYRVQ